MSGGSGRAHLGFEPGRKLLKHPGATTLTHRRQLYEVVPPGQATPTVSKGTVAVQAGSPCFDHERY